MEAPFSLDGAEVGQPVNDEQLGKRERNKLDKQRRIVAAATELFKEKGFEATTTAEIAERADIGAGTLYLYVESKEDLLVAAFNHDAGGAWAKAFELVDEGDTLHAQIMCVFGHVTKHHDADRRLARSFFKEIPYVSPTVYAGTVEFSRWFNTSLESLLAGAADAGKLDPQVPREPLAQNLYSIWQMLMRRLSTDGFTLDTMLAHLDDGVRVALWGITPR